MKLDNIVLNKIAIIDTSYAIHRNLHIQNVFDLRNSKGERTGGVFGSLRTIISELRKLGGYFPIACYDSGLSPRRVEVDPCYKRANERDTEYKELTPEEADTDYVTQYRIQRNRLIEVLSYFGIPSLKFRNWEGDDLMYLLSKISKDSVVITDDRDMLQLLSESCRVRRPMADEMWSIDTFLESKGYSSVYDFILEKSVLGDGSDNIPKSVKGVGGGTFSQYLKILNLFKKDNNDFDFSSYPRNIEDMKRLCESNNVKFRNAFLNFDEERFRKNIKLVDLNLVDIDERIYNSVISTIMNSESLSDYFKAARSLGELEINEVSIDELFGLVSSRRYNVLAGGNEV